MNYILLLFFIINASITYPQIIGSKISVEPLRQIITVSPGEKYMGVLLCRNVSEQKIHVSVRMRDWYVLKENRDITCNTWLKISPTEFDLQPNQAQEVQYEVFVPENAVGELAAMISFHSKERPEEMVEIVTSVPVYVRIKGTIRLDAVIEKIDIVQPPMTPNIVRFAIIVKNNGLAHIRPVNGSIKVIKLERKFLIFRQEKEFLQLNIKTGQPVFPGRIEAFFADCSKKELKPGKYKLVSVIDYGNPDDILSKTVLFMVTKEGKIYQLK